MCLLVVRHRAHPRYPLVIAANRDEFHARGTERLAFWGDAPHVLAGRDAVGGGTWLGITRLGRWAAVTNVRRAAAHVKGSSRGALTARFLIEETPLEAYADEVRRTVQAYDGFNLLLGDGERVLYVSSTSEPRLLAPGDYALSNDTLDTPWPKVRALRTKLSGDDIADDEEALIDALHDRTLAADEELPDTGVGIALERFLSPVFIAGDVYGTRSSTIIRRDTADRYVVRERAYGPNGVALDDRRVTLGPV